MSLEKFWKPIILGSNDASVLLLGLGIQPKLFYLASQPKRKKLIEQFALIQYLTKEKINIIHDVLQPIDKDLHVIEYLQVLENLQLIPFWSNFIQQTSQQIWIPNGNTTTKKSHSWFTIKEEQTAGTITNLLSDQQLNAPISQLTRGRKVKMDPTVQQKRFFKRWIGTSRYLYNQAISLLETDYQQGKYWSKTQLRDRLVTTIPSDQPWLKETPQGIRGDAVFQAWDAFNTNVKKSQQTGKGFQMKYRTKKAPSQTMGLPTDAIKPPKNRNKPQLYPTILGSETELHCKKPNGLYWRDKIINVKDQMSLQIVRDEDGNPMISEDNKIQTKLSWLYKKKTVGKILLNEVRIQYTRRGHWYLCYPITITSKNSETQGDLRSIALDPGVRTFLTGYSPNGQVLELGTGNIASIRNYLLKTDKLVSKISNMKGKEKRRCTKAKLRRFQQVRNWITDCHRKIAKKLVTEYDIIMLPKFQSQKMSQRSSRGIGNKTVRSMLTWSHYKFSQILLDKAEEYGKLVIQPSEEWTSKTCSRCGCINMNLGSSKRFCCLKCKLVIDRDINGARNIYLKGIESLLNGYFGTCLTLKALETKVSNEVD